MSQWRLAAAFRRELFGSCQSFSYCSSPEPSAADSKPHFRQFTQGKPHLKVRHLKAPLALLSSVLVMLYLKNKQSEKEEVEARKMFDQWILENQKSYPNPAEREKRFNIFKENLSIIKKHNSRDNTSSELGLTSLADVSIKEFKEKYCYQMPLTTVLQSNSQMVIYQEGDILPKSVDWREQSVLCGIKDQTPTCGCCYDFASLAAVEALNKIKTGNLVELSAQQVIDCDPRNFGCLGGNFLPVFMFIMENGGICTEKEYPYTGRFGPCCKKRRRSFFSFWKDNPIVTINGFGFVANDELSLKKAVSIQPICASILVTDNFSLYRGDMYRESLKLMDYLNLPKEKHPRSHAVLIVGYGTTAEGEDYWILRNSYGTNWGEKGYMRVSSKAAHTWGITLGTVYPIKYGGRWGNRS